MAAPLPVPDRVRVGVLGRADIVTSQRIVARYASHAGLPIEGEAAG